jgi:hypothetical protein
MGIFSAEVKWFYLDPDNRKKDPERAHCCRCKRTLTEHKNERMRVVRIHTLHPWVTNDPLGDSLIGLDCWKQVEKNPVPVEFY